MHGLAELPDSPNFQRVRAALKFEEPDRVPIAELLVNREVKSAFLGRPLGDPEVNLEEYLRNDIAFSVAAGYDFVRLMALGEFGVPDGEDAGAQSFKIEGSSREWANESARLIASREDLENYPFPDPSKVDLSHIEIGTGLMPEGMEALVSIKGGGIFERAWRLMGFEEFCLASAMEPELTGGLMEKIGSWYCAVWERIVSFPRVAGIWLPDDLAYTESFMLSPEIFRRQLFPWFERLGAICRSRDKLFFYHCDGRIWEVLEDLIAIGIDVLHPIEPKAMDIREVKQKVKGRLALIGNVDLDYPLSRGRPEEVEEAAKALIADLAPGGGWCLGSSNSIPEYVPLENYLALLRAGRRWGNYPVAPG
jgi:uroporphyrinogen decarboxylase